MRVCFDTNVLMRVFTRRRSFPGLLRGLIDGRLVLVVSNEILFEYREVITELFGREGWDEVIEVLEGLKKLSHIVEVSPSFRFDVIAADVDDNKFVDCAIAGDAEYVVSFDRHFSVLAEAGYRPGLISPEELLEKLNAK